MYEDEISNTALLFTINYNKLIDTAESYIKESEKLRKSDKGALYEAIAYQRVLRETKAELRFFTHTVSEYILKNNAPGKTITWGEALSEHRGEVVQIEEKDRVSEGNTSEVYRLKNSTGEYKYFKEEEKFIGNASGIWTDLFVHRKSMDGYDPSFEKELEEFNKNLYNKVFRDVEQSFPNKRKMQKNAFYAVFVNLPFLYRKNLEAYGKDGENANFFYDLMSGNGHAGILSETESDFLDGYKKYKVSPIFPMLRKMQDKAPKLLMFIGDMLAKLSKTYNTAFLASEEA